MRKLIAWNLSCKIINKAFKMRQKRWKIKQRGE